MESNLTESAATVPSIGRPGGRSPGPRGKALVVLDPRGKRGRYGRAEIFGVLTGNKFTPIPHGTFVGDGIAW